MDKLQELPSITRLSDHVVRILGQNPGKFTLQGTNTYLIGKSNPYTLVDTAEGRPEYISVLSEALRGIAKPAQADQPEVSDIIISHWHHDHVGGLRDVLNLLRKLWDDRNNDTQLPFRPPRLHKFPAPAYSPLPPSPRNQLWTIVDSLPPYLYTPNPFGKPFHDLHDDETSFSSSLKVLHTPGHTSDSVALYIPSDEALYTADTVLGQGTAVFEDLSTYIDSLRKMLSLSEPYNILYPGHGPVVNEGKELISTYIKHRLEREGQIVQVLKTPEGQEKWTTWDLVKVIYKAYPESLWLPAAHGVDLHLKKLEVDGMVKKVAGDGVHTEWAVV